MFFFGERRAGGFWGHETAGWGNFMVENCVKIDGFLFLIVWVFEKRQICGLKSPRAKFEGGLVFLKLLII